MDIDLDWIVQDGGPSWLVIVVFGTVLLTLILFLWGRSRKAWMGRLELAEEQLERLASDEDKMAAVLGDVLERVLDEPAPSRMRVVR